MPGQELIEGPFMQNYNTETHIIHLDNDKKLKYNLIEYGY